MFDFIKKIFFRKKTEKIKSVCSINFEINYDGTMNIVCFWPNFNKTNYTEIEPIGTDFANLLFAINNGLMQEDVMKTLTSLIDKSNDYDNLFINVCLVKWLENIEKTVQSKHIEEPLIKPFNVFRQYTTR